VPVEEFTAPGDAFRIDVAYRPNGVTHFLHALSLGRDWNQAKLLSYTFGRIRTRLTAEMAAIVWEEGRSGGGAQSCRQILTESGISVQPLQTLDDYLQLLRM
jgi:hypothetical protein